MSAVARSASDAPSVVIGLDCGTTSTKAVAVDRSGRTIASSHRPSPTILPAPSCAETDMEQLWQSAATTLRELTGRLARLGCRIEVIGISGTMGGAWMLDRAGRPVRNAILWNDGRACDVIERWRRDGTLSAIFAVSANVPVPGFSLAVLHWLVEHEPESIRSAHVMLFCKDWIRFKLTGEICTEESDASHAPGDVRCRDFSLDLLHRCGLSACERLLPRRVPSGSIAGSVTPEAAIQTGLPEGLPVVAGLADVSATLVGGGAIESGIAVTIAGTSLLNCVIAREPLFEPREIGLSFLVPDGLHARAMPNQAGAMAIDWFSNTFLRDANGEALAPDERDRIAASIPPGAAGVMFHPYVNHTGLVAPIHAPAARGQFSGLSVEHSQAHLLRAVYEGVALAMTDCHDALPPTSVVRMVGGLARSAFFCQLCADASGRVVETMRTSDAGAVGVAMLAGVATGLWSSLADASRSCCSVSRQFQPDADTHGRYRGQLSRYRRIRDRLVEESRETQGRCT